MKGIGQHAIGKSRPRDGGDGHDQAHYDSVNEDVEKAGASLSSEISNLSITKGKILAGGKVVYQVRKRQTALA